jgi:hypothetical protein
MSNTQVVKFTSDIDIVVNTDGSYSYNSQLFQGTNKRVIRVNMIGITPPRTETDPVNIPLSDVTYDSLLGNIAIKLAYASYNVVFEVELQSYNQSLKQPDLRYRFIYAVGPAVGVKYIENQNTRQVGFSHDSVKSK